MHSSTQKMKYFILLIQICVIHGVTAQNVIYFADETKVLGKVTDILPNKIKFTDEETDKSESRQNEKLCFAFNSKGSYLTFSKDVPLTPKEKEDFIKQVGDPNDFDVVGYVSGEVIFTKITKETENQLSYINDKTVTTTVPTSIVTFLIRKDGTHKIYTSNKQAAPVLKLNQQKVNDFIQKSNVIKPSGEPAENNVVTISYEQKKRFGKIATDKVAEFTTYVKEIYSTDIASAEKNKDVNLACDLFKQDAQIEISNVNIPDKKNKYPIRNYLNLLLYNAARYQKIVIESADINYVTQFKQATDGSYYGTVSYVQKFIGYIDGVPAYQDITTRGVEIIIKTYYKLINGQEIRAYDVVLGDVSVKETRRKMR